MLDNVLDHIFISLMSMALYTYPSLYCLSFIFYFIFLVFNILNRRKLPIKKFTYLIFCFFYFLDLIFLIPSILYRKKSFIKKFIYLIF